MITKNELVINPIFGMSDCAIQQKIIKFGCIESLDSIMYVTLSVYSKKVERSVHQIKRHVANGILPGAIKVGLNAVWVIPIDTPYPVFGITS